MYKRNAQGWAKHLDFIVIDEISLQIAFVLAVFFRHRAWAYSSLLYINLGFVLALVNALVLVLHNSMHNVMTRGYYVEIAETIKHCFYVFAIATIFMFATQSGIAYSRIISFLTFLLHIALGYAFRVVWKLFLKKCWFVRQKKKSMLVVVDPETAEELLKRLNEDKLSDYIITGVILTEETGEKTIGKFPIVTNLDNAADYIVREWVDSVYIDSSFANEKVIKLMDNCALMGVPTHFHVPNMCRNGVKRFSEKLGGTTVLTSTINYASPIQALMKRGFDIFAGLIGSVIAIIIMAIVGPIIKKQSPGPILFVQERIGQNGKRFKMYNVRCMQA